MELEYRIKLGYPLPICNLYQSVRIESESRHRIHKLVDLVEGTVRYLSLLGLAHYSNEHLYDSHVEDARKKLEKPSFGHWVGLYRSLTNSFADRSAHLFSFNITTYAKDSPLVLAV